MSSIKKNIQQAIYEIAREKQGQIRADNVSSILYDQGATNPSPNFSPDIKITRRRYSFDRGAVFPLSPEQFLAYSDTNDSVALETVSGNFIDNVTDNYTNSLYGFLIYSERSKTVSFKIYCVNSSIVIYAGTEGEVTKLYTSGDNYFPSGGTINIELEGGKRTAVRIFHYQRFKQGNFRIDGYLGTQITAWSVLDIFPPPTPEWDATTPISTTYKDSRIGSAEVTLRWKNPLRIARDNVDGIDYSDWAGTGIYRANQKGWESLGVAATVSGVYFDINGSILPPLNGSVKYNNVSNPISGIIGSYEYDNVDDITTIMLSSGTGPSVSDTIYVENYKHLIDIEKKLTHLDYLEYVDVEVANGTEYSYKLDFYDDSFLRNRSAKTSEQTIIAGDSTPPGVVTSLTNESLDEDTFRLSWTSPTDDDLRGFHIITNYGGYSTTTASVTSANIFDVTAGISNFSEGGFLTISGTGTGGTKLRKIRSIA